VSRSRRRKLTKKRPLSCLGCIVTAVGSLVLLSTLTTRNPKKAIVAPDPESLPLTAPTKCEPETVLSQGTTVADHAAPKSVATATLSELLETNQKIIEVIGVFTAISFFTGQLGIRWFAYVVTFLFTTLVLILCVELWTRFPSQSDSMKVMLFKGILTLAVLLLLLDFFVDYRDIWRYFLVYPIAATIFGVVLFGFAVPAVRRSPLRKNKRLLGLVATVTAIVLLCSSMRLAVLIEPGLNRFLDTLYKMISSWTH